MQKENLPASVQMAGVGTKEKPGAAMFLERGNKRQQLSRVVGSAFKSIQKDFVQIISL